MSIIDFVFDVVSSVALDAVFDAVFNVAFNVVFAAVFRCRQVIARGLQELITFEIVDYRDFAKQHSGEFDRIISCEMVRDWKTTPTSASVGALLRSLCFVSLLCAYELDFRETSQCENSIVIIIVGAVGTPSVLVAVYVNIAVVFFLWFLS